MKQNTCFPSIGLMLAFSLIGGMPAQAQDDWRYTGFVYLWGAGIGGETVTGQRVDVSFSDIVDTLDFGIMGTLEARNGPWAVFADAIYLNISDNDDATAGPGIPASANVDIKGFVLTSGVGYDLLGAADYRLNGFGGLRYLDMDTTANISVGAGSDRVSDNFNNWDAVVGLRGHYALSQTWDLVYYADVGAGDTDLTWQAAAAIDYAFDNWTLTVGYRHLSWDDLNGSKTLSDIEFSGPFVGAKFRF